MRKYTVIIEFDGKEYQRSSPMDIYKANQWIGNKKVLLANHFRNKSYKIFLLTPSVMTEEAGITRSLTESEHEKVIKKYA